MGTALLEISQSFQRQNNVENRLKRDKVAAMSWWSTFLGHRVRKIDLVRPVDLV